MCTSYASIVIQKMARLSWKHCISTWHLQPGVINVGCVLWNTVLWLQMPSPHVTMLQLLYCKVALATLHTELT